MLLFYLQQVSSESQVEHLHYYWYVNATPNYSGPEADIIEDIRWGSAETQVEV